MEVCRLHRRMFSYGYPLSSLLHLLCKIQARQSIQKKAQKLETKNRLQAKKMNGGDNIYPLKIHAASMRLSDSCCSAVAFSTSASDNCSAASQSCAWMILSRSGPDEILSVPTPTPIATMIIIGMIMAILFIVCWGALPLLNSKDYLQVIFSSNYFTMAVL